MIVVDLEMSGMDYEKCGIVQIGAIDLDSKEEFLENCHLDEEDKIINEPNLEHTVLDTLGMTEEQLRDSNKQNQKEILEHFFEWCKKTNTKNFICFHPHADIAFLEHKARKYNLKFPFLSYKAWDLHSIAQMVYFQLNREFSFKDKDGQKQSAMNLKATLKLAGIEDKRAENHNALEDARLTAEAFFRLVYGKNLLEEYANFPVPEYLTKGGAQKSN